MQLNNLLLEKTERYAIVTINRPEKLNALNTDTIRELQQVMQSLNRDPKILSVIMTGAGEKAFVAGADIAQITSLNEKSGSEFARKGQQVFREIERMRKPVIAAVNGFALGGGCELAMACHLRIAAEGARFGQPEINLGIIPGYGGTQRLPRLIGISNALHLLLSGEMINAQRAYQLGLVSEVVAGDQLLTRAKALAETFAGKAPLASAYILEALYRGMDSGLDEALEIEAAYFGKACATEDMQEGTRAFMEKRKAAFKGR